MWAGGKLGALLQPPEYLTIVGVAIGSMLAATPRAVLLTAVRKTKAVFGGGSGFTSEFYLTRAETLAEETDAHKALRAELPHLPGLIAFQKAEGLQRTGECGSEVWFRIGSAQVVTPRYDRTMARVEIDLTRQILILLAGVFGVLVLFKREEKDGD